ncbi:M23 family metallopeptidase [Streptomyces sp. NPDC058700]|uniref:M23 family metallopeptidase n=1 Tax=unclassified Streptomyces TaxID=2593676 RepID=UPI003662CEC4
MASNTPAPEAPFDAFGGGAGPAAPGTEWNPTEDSLRAQSRSGGRHRVVKQRSHFARSSTVLGVGVIAAVGAGGLATAQERPPVAISLPDLPDLNLPDAHDLPGVGDLLPDEDADTASDMDLAAAEAPRSNPNPLTAATYTTPDDERGATAAQAATAATGTADAGEALRARILQQAEQQQASADAADKAAAEKAAAERAAAEAAAKAEAAEKAAAEAKAKAEAEAKAKAEEEARAKAEAERLAQLAASYSMPLSSYSVSATYMQSGSMWSSGHHTGLDFAAPTGTPLKAVHGATVKSAGWSGSYGYRIVLELEDGTEVWYCHLSSMTVGVGQTVGTGETIGRVGATGNVTGAHLHMEVHTPGGSGIDPAEWLRSKGLTV